MAKLPTLKSQIPVLGQALPMLEQAAPGSSRDDRNSGRGRFYDTRLWRDEIRPRKLRRDPLCEYCRDRDGMVTRATEVDHVDGDSSNNRDDNLKSTCKPCHSTKTAKENGSFGNEKR